MENKGIESINAGRTGEVLSAEPSRAVGIPGKGKGDFEDLLNRVTRDMVLLKGETQKGEHKNAIEKPEELEAALEEAGRNFSSVMKAGRNLIKAYQATLKALETYPHTGREQ